MNALLLMFLSAYLNPIPPSVMREHNLVVALDAYCEGVEYRDDICEIQLPEDFGDIRGYTQ